MDNIWKISIFLFILVIIISVLYYFNADLAILGGGATTAAASIAFINNFSKGRAYEDVDMDADMDVDTDANVDTDVDTTSAYHTGSAEKYTPVQKKIFQNYKRCKSPKQPPTFYEFCYPRTFALQPQQKFLPEYIIKNWISTLIFHSIGSGKTRTGIEICEAYLNRYNGGAPPRNKRPMFIMPASLIPNQHTELATIDKYKNDDGDPDEDEIDKHYNLLSYNKFLMNIKEGVRQSAPILIIDEVQNMSGGSQFGNSVLEFIKKRPDMLVVLMTGTPIFDNASELTHLAHLLRLDPQNYTDEGLITLGETKRIFNRHVSYYAGAPDYTFPSSSIHIALCEMSPLQYKYYLSEVAAELKNGHLITSSVSNNFYLRSRQRSNIVFPSKRMIDGVDSLKPEHIETLSTYSAKFAKLLPKLRRGELSFVYTSFKDSAGIAALIKILEYNGFKNFKTNGAGKRRFAIWSGDERRDEKAHIAKTFNDKLNQDASQIQIVIGSPAIKEGVTLKRIKQVHVMEMYWNHSRLAQIYGRAIRFCSHKGIKKADRHVDVYLYAAIAPDTRLRFKNTTLDDTFEVTPEESIDLYMLQIANHKKQVMEPYIDTLINVAVDKKLYRY